MWSKVKVTLPAASTTTFCDVAAILQFGQSFALPVRQARTTPLALRRLVTVTDTLVPSVAPTSRPSAAVASVRAAKGRDRCCIDGHRNGNRGRNCIGSAHDGAGGGW